MGTTIHCNQEFNEMMNQIKDNLNINVIPTSAQEHQPEAERNNRTIKEHCRTAFHRLPFKTILREMIKCLVLSATDQFNCFPVKEGVSDTLSPRLILGQGNLNYKKHCKYLFGAYIQAHDETHQRKTQHTRTLDAIYSRPLGKRQGRHLILDLTTGHQITRRNLADSPMPQQVIARVEALATRDGIRNNKFKSKEDVH